MSTALADSIAQNGDCPSLISYVFLSSSGTATVKMEIVGPGGKFNKAVSLSVTTTPQNLKQLIGSTFDPDHMIGARLISTDVTVYWNTAGTDVNTNSNGYTTAPTSSSCSVPAGNYAADPYKLGVCN